jgi:hypothetical protein
MARRFRKRLLCAAGSCAALFLALAEPAFAQEAAVARRMLLEGRITLELPVSLQPLSDEMRRSRYPGNTHPPIAYADASGDVTLGADWTALPLQSHEIRARLAQLREEMVRVARVQRWHQSAVVVIDGREVGILDFDRRVLETEIRVKLAMVELDGRMALISFRIPKQNEGAWPAAAARALRSLRFGR